MQRVEFVDSTPVDARKLRSKSKSQILKVGDLNYMLNAENSYELKKVKSILTKVKPHIRIKDIETIVTLFNGRDYKLLNEFCLTIKPLIDDPVF